MQKNIENEVPEDPQMEPKMDGRLSPDPSGAHPGPRGPDLGPQGPDRTLNGCPKWTSK